MKAKLEDLNEVELMKGVRARFFSGEKMMFSCIRLEPAVVLPKHSHPHEQMGYVIEGSLVLIADGAEVTLTAGDVYVLRGGQEHEAVAGDDGVMVLDVFAPPREEYLEMIE